MRERIGSLSSGLAKGLAVASLFLAGLVDRPSANAKDWQAIFPLHAEIVSGEELLTLALQPWKGDLDGMIERAMIRVLVDYDGMFYFVDRFRQRGLTYDQLTLFEKQLNKKLGLQHGDQVEVVFIPVGNDRLIPDLLEGVGDIAVAHLTVTPDRLEKVDFSTPVMSGVKELLVTGKDFPKVEAPEDLSGKEVVVRPLSSYDDSLRKLNERLAKAGKPPVQITPADENLTDGALADMVASGIYPATVMDSYEVDLWGKVYPDLVVHDDVVLREDGEIAWAFRKHSPQLKKAADAFVAKHQVGTWETDALIRRYLKNTRYVREALSDKANRRFEETVDYFKTYAQIYNFDWLLLVAQGFQESRLDQNARSSVGAIGIMQLLPSTAAGPPIHVRNIYRAEANIHAGAKYMRYIIDQYFDDPAISRVDKHLFALAAYNAGPNRIAHLRGKAAKQRLDPNKWFDNVELIVARKVGRQPVDYVANIFKYYVAYRRNERLRDAQEIAKETAQ